MDIRGGYVAVVLEAKCLTDLGQEAFRPAAKLGRQGLGGEGHIYREDSEGREIMCKKAVLIYEL